MKKQRVACGFVLVREREDRQEYLLLTNAERGEPGLPKGHAEPDDASELATARRETEEETGLTDLDIAQHFVRELRYPASRKGETYDKRVVYFLARLRSGEVRLSAEHSRFQWLTIEEAWHALPFPNLRGIVREAALWLKDPGLFGLEPWTQDDADAWLSEQTETTPGLLAHLRGGARLARVFAKGLAEAGIPVDVEATAAGTLLHDAGRALGEHADHPRAGLKAIRKTRLAPYAFACLSHFTKGAPIDELVDAGIDREMLEEAAGLVELARLTWEERCAALADACMKQDVVVRPEARFADLRARYENAPVIDVQERHTAKIRSEIADVLGRDPLAMIGL